MQTRNLKCPHCGFEPEYGVTVCRGCGAEIMYGPTFGERVGSGCMSFLAGAFLPALLIGGLMDVIGISQNSEVSGIMTILIFGFAVLLGIVGFFLASKHPSWKKPRFYRRY